MIGTWRFHPNDGAYMTVRELRAAAYKQAEINWPPGSSGGSDKRHQARIFVDQVIECALQEAGAQARANELKGSTND